MSRFERIALVSGLIVASGWVAVYVLNPFRSPSWSPLARIAGVDAFRATSGSMEPTLARGEAFHANAWPYLSRDPARGEIVTFRHPSDPSAQYVKRVVAAGGDRIALSGCIVVLNGERQREPYAVVNGPDPHGVCDIDEVQVPPDHYYLLGDNRLNSDDSRFWGPVPRKNILGRVAKR